MKIHLLFEHSADLQPHGSSHIRLLRPLQHPLQAGRWQVTYGTDYTGGADLVIVERTWRPGPGVLAAVEALVERLRGERRREAGLLSQQRALADELALRAERFDFCPEVTSKLLRRGHAIFEVPISYRGRGTNEGKKIRWTDAFHAWWTLVRYRFFD